MGAVLVIWWITLVVAAVVVLPTVWYLLHRVLRAARAIERYAADTLAAGAGIARNTAAVSALQTTIAVATQMLAGADAIARSAGAIEQALGRQRLEGGRR
ncbi:MAG: hypothetical protein QN187_15625 [Armatimonadota bacterium]|nr:hypothetical protein [Armatimonadota bacterium]MDR7534275.1 hypothetical protein [Armatimonadota bacterium]